MAYKKQGLGDKIGMACCTAIYNMNVFPAQENQQHNTAELVMYNTSSLNTHALCINVSAY